MSDFYIVPPRLIVGSLQRSNVVTSLNTLRGDLSFKINPDTGLTLNINSGVFTLGLTPDFYIKKSGDTVPSNIIFQPEPGKYGLAVGSGAADPGTGVSGALYFNTTYGVLKVYNGSVWNEIASTGTSGITQSFADTRYLRLDGGNVPTGAISMGSQFLRFANLTTRSLAGTAGQVYYNTDTNKLDLYNGSSWIAVGSGITQLTAGNGISLSSNPITTFGAVSIDQSYNFNWTGSHTYTNPITFSSSQTFDASKLTIAYEVQGDILHFNGANWARLPLGTPNQVLSVSNCGGDVEWHSLVAGSGIAISYAYNQLIFSNTGGSGGVSGTGASVYIGVSPPPWTSNVGDLWWNSENGALNIYYSDADTTQWVEINSFVGGIDPTTNISGITSLNGILQNVQYFATGKSGNDFNIVSSGSTHTFNIPYAAVGVTGLISGLAQTIGGTKTFANGLISGNGVTIYSSLYLPNNPLASIYGGTGYTNYALGDIVVGSGTSTIKLSRGTDGFVLQSNSSYPSGLGWTHLSNVAVSSTTPSSPYQGDLWWNSIDGSLSVYYSDGDTNQWVEVGTFGGSTAGSTVDVLGLYNLNGLTNNTQYFSIGSSGTNFNISSIGQTHIFNLPLAGNGVTGLVSSQSQTIYGDKNFNGLLSFTQASIGIAGTTVIPTMAFIGQTNNPITLSVLPDNSLSFDSASGQLFKITNNLLSGYLFSVNDVSGIPLIRANADMTVSMAEYGGYVGIGLSNPSYKLDVTGTARISQSLTSPKVTATQGFVETVYAIGTTSGSNTPVWTNGSIQTLTLNGSLTLNAPSSMPTGANMTLIIAQDSFGGRTMTPSGSYKFKSGLKTLSSIGNSIDIIKIFYDGTNYYADLNLGYS